MERAGLRELRQHASGLVRRAEAGETITVTVSGRDVAQLVPLQQQRWRTWSDLADLYSGSTDPAWDVDRDRVDQAPCDPYDA